jgi:tetratricopeptide repeat protein 30
LNFLLTNPPFPPETFTNLLLLYVKPPNYLYEFAADTIAQHPDYVQRFLSRDMLTFLSAVNMKQASPEDAAQQFERIAKQHIEKLRLLMKMTQVVSQTLFAL